MGRIYAAYKPPCKVKALNYCSPSADQYLCSYVLRTSQGNVYLEMGRMGEAIAKYESALAADPFLTDAYNNLGSAYKIEGSTPNSRA